MEKTLNLKTVVSVLMTALKAMQMQCLHGQRTKKMNDKNPSLLEILDTK